MVAIEYYKRTWSPTPVVAYIFVQASHHEPIEEYDLSCRRESCVSIAADTTRLRMQKKLSSRAGNGGLGDINTVSRERGK